MISWFYHILTENLEIFRKNIGYKIQVEQNILFSIIIWQWLKTRFIKKNSVVSIAIIESTIQFPINFQKKNCFDSVSYAWN